MLHTVPPCSLLMSALSPFATFRKRHSRQLPAATFRGVTQLVGVMLARFVERS